MILGKGRANSEEEIIDEYHQFLLGQNYCQKILKILKEAPGAMKIRIGKPLSDWEDDDILDLFSHREKQTHFRYCAFIAFLFFHGYRKASIYILTRLPTHLTRLHREALKPARKLLEETSVELQYSNKTSVGSELNRLIWLLAVVGKPLEDITRDDFDRFSTEYHQWFGQAERCRSIKTDGRVGRIERFLVHWKIIPPVRRTFKHEEYFNSLKHENIRNGILAYMNWYEAKSAPSSVNSRRVQVINFFLWMQENYPESDRLDDANRKVALGYSRYLRGNCQ